MSKPYVLWLIWQNKETRQRYHVGNLVHKDHEYYFQYEKQRKHRGLEEALENGYRPHLSFPDTEKVYFSQKLFGTFARRLPHKGRPDYQELLRKYSVPEDHTQLDLLRITGGKLATDTYELVQPITFHQGQFDADFYIAGWRYYDGPQVVNNLFEGQQLKLALHADNPEDRFAVRITDNKNNVLGFVPAFYSEFMYRVITNNLAYKIQIEKIDLAASSQQKVLISFRAVNSQISVVDENNFEGAAPYETIV